MEQAVLLTSVHVVDPQGPWHNQVVDVLLQGGQVAYIGPALKAPEALVLSAEGSMVSPGWIDGQAHFREPEKRVYFFVQCDGVANFINCSDLKMILQVPANTVQVAKNLYAIFL